MVDTIAEPLLVLDASLCVKAASRSFFETFDVDSYETIGQPVYELGNGQWNIPELRHLLEEVIPKASAVINYEVEHDFPHLGRRMMLLTARTLHAPNGGGRSMLLSIVDATAQHQRNVAKDLLFGELQHRLKNLLSVIQALANQTTTADRSASEYRDAFMGRLSALIEAEDLAYGERGETDLEELINRIFAPYSSNFDAVPLKPGGAVDLDPRSTRSLAMVLHEMATIAAKYGALSVPSGQVRLSWLVDDANKLTLNWVESGGPPVTAPATTGFGSTLVQSTIIYGLRGRLEQEYTADGYRAEIIIPLGNASVED